MRWSKLKHLTESRFADGVRGRVALHTTRYRYRLSMIHNEARSWITIDGREIINMTRWNEVDRRGVEYVGDRRFEVGVFHAYDLEMACEEMLTLPIEDALASPNPLVRALAVLDRRAGRRRLAGIDGDGEIPPVAELLAFRRTACQRRFASA